MNNVYTQSDYDNALKLRKNLLIWYFIGLGVFLIPVTVIFILYLNMPYPSTTELEKQKNLYLVIKAANGLIKPFIRL